LFVRQEFIFQNEEKSVENDFVEMEFDLNDQIEEILLDLNLIFLVMVELDRIVKTEWNAFRNFVHCFLHRNYLTKRLKRQYFISY